MAKKGRAWSNLDGQLPEEPKPPTERELAIRKRCDELRGLAVDPKTGEPIAAKTMRELALDYGTLDEEQEFEDLAGKARSIEYEALERVIRTHLEEVREVSGQDTWRGEGHTFAPKFTPIPIITDLKALEDWIKANGHGYLYGIKESKLKELVLAALNTEAAVGMSPEEREALKPGDPASGQPPPGVSVFMRKGVRHN